MTKKKTSGRWLTVVLVLAILAVVGWIANTYLDRRAAAANDYDVARVLETSNDNFSRTGTQATDARHFVGGNYRLIAIDTQHCITQISLREATSRKRMVAVGQKEVRQGEPVNLLPGDYYVQGETDLPDCPWEAKLIPE